MTYPYGMHGAPAVGGGLPGLPRRSTNISLHELTPSVDLITAEIDQIVSGIYEIPDNSIYYRVTIVGGGGKGGQNPNSSVGSASGGGGGGFARSKIIPVLKKTAIEYSFEGDPSQLVGSTVRAKSDAFDMQATGGKPGGSGVHPGGEGGIGSGGYINSIGGQGGQTSSSNGTRAGGGGAGGINNGGHGGTAGGASNTSGGGGGGGGGTVPSATTHFGGGGGSPGIAGLTGYNGSSANQAYTYLLSPISCALSFDEAPSTTPGSQSRSMGRSPGGGGGATSSYSGNYGGKPAIYIELWSYSND